MVWVSAAFVALLVVTVAAVAFYFLPVMFTPTPRQPDFDDVDALISRQSIHPDKGAVVGPLPGGGSPVRTPFPPDLRRGTPTHTKGR